MSALSTVYLINETIKWWEEHRYDTCDGGNKNIYDEMPEHVRIAYQLRSGLR